MEAFPSNPGDTIAADGRALGVETIWEGVSERGKASEKSEHCRASKQVSGEANGPVLNEMV